MTKTILLATFCICTLVSMMGCAPLLPKIHIEKVEVPIPIPCNIIPPKKPVMPFTDATDNPLGLDGLADVYVYTQRALAEIERRKGYETELEAAITACNSK